MSWFTSIRTWLAGDGPKDTEVVAGERLSVLDAADPAILIAAVFDEVAAGTTADAAAVAVAERLPQSAGTFVGMSDAPPVRAEINANATLLLLALIRRELAALRHEGPTRAVARRRKTK